jgi:hypothetical protein
MAKGKEIVFTFDRDLSSFAAVSSFVYYVNKITSLLGGISVYIEGKTLVVVM